MLAGALLNAALCVLLKQYFQQPRPEAATLHDCGMPSNHSQVSAYLGAAGLCFLWCDATLQHPRLWKPLVSLATVALVAAVGVSRIYLGEHTVEQVLAGLAVGTLVGCSTHVAYHAALPALRPMLPLAFCRFFYLRDTSHVQDVMRAEYEWHAESAARTAALRPAGGTCDGRLRDAKRSS
jgi:dolichyldiphosphatase